MAAARTLLTVLALTLAGCASDLPISERIAGVRPLAIRVEVQDPLATPDAAVRSEALPVESIRVIPFIVDELAPLSPERITAELEPGSRVRDQGRARRPASRTGGARRHPRGCAGPRPGGVYRRAWPVERVARRVAEAWAQG
jgi:hypothetical protein